MKTENINLNMSEEEIFDRLNDVWDDVNDLKDSESFYCDMEVLVIDNALEEVGFEDAYYRVVGFDDSKYTITLQVENDDFMDNEFISRARYLVDVKLSAIDTSTLIPWLYPIEE